MAADGVEVVERIRAARRTLIEGGPSDGRAEGDFERISLPGDDADALRDLLVAEGAAVVIEIGLAYAGSALAIAEAIVSLGPAEASHLIIDPFQDQFGDSGWNLLVGTGLAERCTLVRERSQLVLPRLVGEGFVADAAFVDGSHIFHNVFVDLFFLGQLVLPRGLIVVDDCQWLSVATAVNYFELNAGWEVVPVGGHTRLRAYRLPGARVDPDFKLFRPFCIEQGAM